MIAAFLLGLTGSLGHCAGMCSGIALLLTRRRDLGPGGILPLHLGRITTYALLGAGAGTLGQGIAGGHSLSHVVTGNQAVAAPLARLQGWFALAAAAAAVYMALALLGRVPPPDRLLTRVSRLWSRHVRGLGPAPRQPGRLFLLGLWWGLLPCGLVLTALLTAAVTATPAGGAAAMLAFGLGTWPILIAAGLSGDRLRQHQARFQPALRYLAALVVLLFGLQLSLRGLAAWGLVTHQHLGEVMLW